MIDSDFSVSEGHFPDGGFHTPDGDGQSSHEADLQETLDGLDESMKAFAAGRWITSEELSQRMTARLANYRASAADALAH